MNAISWRPLAVLLVAAVAATRLVPVEYRLLNFTAIGALAMFATARIGWQAGLLMAGGGMLASDLLLWKQHGYDSDYLPMPSVYVGLLGYGVLAWAFLRRTENPLKIGGVAIAGSAIFFVATNFASWLAQALPYGYTPGGLLNCFEMGLPFHRGTILGDLLFSGMLFGAHAALSRVFQRELVAETVR